MSHGPSSGEGRPITEHAGGLGDAPIDPRFHRNMNGLARALDEWFNGSLRGKEAEANQLRAEIAKAREAAGRTLAGRPALGARSAAERDVVARP